MSKQYRFRISTRADALDRARGLPRFLIGIHNRDKLSRLLTAPSLFVLQPHLKDYPAIERSEERP